MQIRQPTIVLKRGTRGTYSGFRATIVRHYDGDMYEVMIGSYTICIDVHDFIKEA